jgi:hypothetical protein
MGIIAPTSIDIGGARGTEEVDVKSNITSILSLVNGGIDDANIAGGASIALTKLASPVLITLGTISRIVVGTGSGSWSTSTFTPTIAHAVGTVPVFGIGIAIEGGSVFFDTIYVGSSTHTTSAITLKWQSRTGGALSGSMNYAYLLGF